MAVATKLCSWQLMGKHSEQTADSLKHRILMTLTLSSHMHTLTAIQATTIFARHNVFRVRTNPITFCAPLSLSLNVAHSYGDGPYCIIGRIMLRRRHKQTRTHTHRHAPRKRYTEPNVLDCIDIEQHEEISHVHRHKHYSIFHVWVCGCVCMCLGGDCIDTDICSLIRFDVCAFERETRNTRRTGFRQRHANEMPNLFSSGRIFVRAFIFIQP